MPLIISKQLNENLLLAVWQINESLEELSENLVLSNTDQEILSKTSNKQKKVEFLAGRHLVREAAQNLGLNYFPIYRNEYGKPELPNSEWDLSLSHTESLIVSIFGFRKKVGIDIERPNEKIRKISARLFNQDEIDNCKSSLKNFTKLWSAKEVLYKIYMKRGLDFRENIFVEPSGEEWITAKGQIRLKDYVGDYLLHFDQIDEYIVCYNS